LSHDIEPLYCGTVVTKVDAGRELQSNNIQEQKVHRKGIGIFISSSGQLYNGELPSKYSSKNKLKTKECRTD